MLLVLRNFPATFERALDIILSLVSWQTCLIYVDDVIIFGKCEPQHIEEVDEVLILLEDEGVSLKPRKCELFQPKFNYLGHVITPGKLSIDKTGWTAFRMPLSLPTSLISILSLQTPITTVVSSRDSPKYPDPST